MRAEPRFGCLTPVDGLTVSACTSAYVLVRACHAYPCFRVYAIHCTVMMLYDVQLPHALREQRGAC